MGKSKKSTPKADAAPVSVPVPTKSAAKKGKREAEVAVEKAVSTKKQKMVTDGVIVAKKVTETKIQKKKKKEETSSSESDVEPNAKPAPKKAATPLKAQLSSSSDDSDDEPVTKKTPQVNKKSPSKMAPVKGGKKHSSSDSDSSESESDDDMNDQSKVNSQAKKPASGNAKNGGLKADGSSDESDSDSDSDTSSEEEKGKAAVQVKSAPAKAKNSALVAAKKKVESSSSDSSESENDDEDNMEEDRKPTGTANTSKKDESDDSSASDSSDDEVDTKAVTSGASLGVKKAESGSESDSEDDDQSDSNEAPTRPTGSMKTPSSSVIKGKMKTDSEDESSEESDEEPELKQKKTIADGGPAKPITSESDGSTDSSDSDSDDEPSKAQQPNKATVVKTSGKPNTKDSSDEDDSSDESSEDEKSNNQEAKQKSTKKTQERESDEEDSEDEQPSKASEKKDVDVEMVDATKYGKSNNKISDKKAPKTPAKPQGQDSGVKTLFVGNLSYSVTPEDVENFFKAVADVQEVRFSRNQEGNFKGFAHVEFATSEDAQKAYELNGRDLFGRTLYLDFARERGSFTPHIKESNSFQRAGRVEGQTIFVRGFDKSLGAEEIKSALQEHFGSCGEISRISVPTDFESGDVKGIAYLDFKDGDGFNNALEFNGSDLDGYSLYVDQAKPKGDTDAGGDWSGGRSGGRGGRSAGRDSGGRFGGRRGGRDSGGRFSGRHGGGRGGPWSGRGGGRDGGRGRGAPYKIDIGGSGKGKKTTFDNDE